MFHPFPISTSLSISTVTYIMFLYIRYVVTTKLNTSKDRKFTSNLVDSIRFLSIYYVCSYTKHWVYNSEPDKHGKLTMIELTVYQ